MPLPWAGSSGAVKARQPTNDQMQRFSRASQCQAQGATGGGSGLAGAPPPIYPEDRFMRELSLLIRAADFQKGWSLSSHFLKVRLPSALMVSLQTPCPAHHGKST